LKLTHAKTKISAPITEAAKGAETRIKSSRKTRCRTTNQLKSKDWRAREGKGLLSLRIHSSKPLKNPSQSLTLDGEGEGKKRGTREEEGHSK
jgi:hypothetical protein